MVVTFFLKTYKRKIGNYIKIFNWNDVAELLEGGKLMEKLDLFKCFKACLCPLFFVKFLFFTKW